jgi:hypothetical protein
MSDSIEDMDSLELWRVARGIAGDALEAVLPHARTDLKNPSVDDVDSAAVADAFEKQKHANEYWPFRDADELVGIVKRESDFSTDRNVYIDSFAKLISHRLSHGVCMDDAATNDTQTEGEGSTTANTHPDEGNGNGVDETQNGDVSIDVEMEEADEESDEIVQELATDLFQCFIGDGDDTFAEIKQQYDTPFPNRSIILTDLMNTSGTEADRIAAFTPMVEDWYQDETAVNEVNTEAPTPMGMPVR